MSKQKSPPKIKHIIILAKLDNNKIHQIYTTQEQMNEILWTVVNTSESKSIKVAEEPIEGVAIVLPKKTKKL